MTRRLAVAAPVHSAAFCALRRQREPETAIDQGRLRATGLFQEFWHPNHRSRYAHKPVLQDAAVVRSLVQEIYSSFPQTGY